MALQFAFALDAKDSSAFIFGQDDTLLAEKQVIYVGRFQDAKGTWHEVDEDDIDNWVEQFARFTEDGVEVPLPEEHNVLPSFRRGQVMGLSKRADEKGRISLFAAIRFKDLEAKQRFSDSQVSLYSPPEHPNTIKGGVYRRPITHIALTDYPIVPDLGKWQTIAASSVVPKPKDKPMLRELAIALGLAPSDSDTDEMIGESIKDRFSSLSEGLVKQTELAASLQPAPDAPALPAGILNMAKKARGLELSQLVADGQICEAVSKKLAARYIDNTEVLSLSLNSNDPNRVDDFDVIIEAFKENETLIPGSKTGPQVLAFSSQRKETDTKTDNCLTRLAKAKQKRS